MKNDSNKNQYDESFWAAFAIPTQVVLYIVGGAGLGLLVGHFIDAQLHSTPVATFIGLLFGLAVGIYGIFRFVISLK
ncbi:MAG: AtpZ/AtpI family protein [Ktedonobacterales bacterium]